MMLKDEAVLMNGEKVYPTPAVDAVEAEDAKKETQMQDMVDIVHTMD